MPNENWRIIDASGVWITNWVGKTAEEAVRGFEERFVPNQHTSGPPFYAESDDASSPPRLKDTHIAYRIECAVREERSRILREASVRASHAHVLQATILFSASGDHVFDAKLAGVLDAERNAEIYSPRMRAIARAALLGIERSYGIASAEVPAQDTMAETKRPPANT